MLPQSPPTRFLCLACLFAFFGCVKDVDVDQYKEIVVPPTVTVDLVYFDLTSEDLFDFSGVPKTASDETRLDFLDDSYIQESLVDAEFNFIYINRFEQDLVSRVTFKDQNNTARHSFEVQIPAGSPEDPRVVDYVEVFYEDNIDAIRKSIKVEVEIEMPGGSLPAEGDLNLKSRGFYKFEFQ